MRRLKGAAKRFYTVSITDWVSLDKKELRGDFTLTLPCGLILKHCTYFECDGFRWVRGPIRIHGHPLKRETVIEFATTGARMKFSQSVLHEINRLGLAGKVSG